MTSVSSFLLNPIPEASNKKDCQRKEGLLSLIDNHEPSYLPFLYLPQEDAATIVHNSLGPLMEATANGINLSMTHTFLREVHCDNGINLSVVPDFPENVFDFFFKKKQHVEPKQYNIKLKSLWAAFCPRTMLLNAAASLSPVLVANVQSTYSENASSPDYDALLKKSLWVFVKECLVVTSRSLFQRALFLYFTPKWIMKFTKDFPSSAVRKHKRGVSGLYLIYPVFVTTIRTCWLSNLSNVTVNFTYEALSAAYRVYSTNKKEKQDIYESIKKEGKIVLDRTITVSMFSVGILVIGSISSGVGASISPRLGALIGFNVGGAMAPFIITELVALVTSSED